MTAISVQPVPPTTHNVPHAQRLRLMRSSRKLRALLGETPLLVDSLPNETADSRAAHTRSASVPVTQPFLSTHSAQSSASLRNPPSRGKTYPPSYQNIADSRPMLLMRARPSARSTDAAQTVPIRPTRTRKPASMPTADTLRRRKMAKVVQTLGAHVPTELVFPASPRKRQRRPSQISIVDAESTFADEDVESWLQDCDGTSTKPASSGSVIQGERVTSWNSGTTILDSPIGTGTAMSRQFLLPYPAAAHNMPRKQDEWGSGDFESDVELDNIVCGLRRLRMKSL